MNVEIAVSKEVEITVRVRNEPGLLAKLFATVASGGSEVLACSSYSNGKWAVVLLVAEKPARTERMLEEGGFEYGTDSVVVVSAPEAAGCGAILSAQLRTAGIRILYSYTSWSEPDNVRAVFKTDDDERAQVVLRTCAADAFQSAFREEVPTVPAHNRWNGLAVRH